MFEFTYVSNIGTAVSIINKYRINKEFFRTDLFDSN